ncbi:MAG: VOC family protein [Rhodobacteraceae bacterium]|nr:VOC family protein [Paracoccaceae bacterium]
MSIQSGKVFWTELNARNLDSAKDFYGSLFGWQYEAMEIGEGIYWMAKQDGEPVVGMMNVDSIPGGENIPPNWFSYFSVSDMEKAIETVASKGGNIVRAPWEIPGIGTIAIISDSVGAVLGLVQPVATE